MSSLETRTLLSTSYFVFCDWKANKAQARWPGELLESQTPGGGGVVRGWVIGIRTNRALSSTFCVSLLWAVETFGKIHEASSIQAFLRQDFNITINVIYSVLVCGPVRDGIWYHGGSRLSFCPALGNWKGLIREVWVEGWVCILLLMSCVLLKTFLKLLACHSRHPKMKIIMLAC